MRILILAAALFMALSAQSVFAHGGVLDANRCHYDHKNGGYHCHAATWEPLGGDLNPQPAAYVSSPSLAGDPRSNPVVAFAASDPTTIDETTYVSRWNGSRWIAVGSALPAFGPAIGLDNAGGIFLCTDSGSDSPDPGPYVWRWDGTTWLRVGGDVSVETGYPGVRYSVDACGGIVLDSSGAPIVSWSADVGAKANAVYAARWDDVSQKWVGLGSGSIGGRATDTYLDISQGDHLYLATWKPGGSYGGNNTTYAWRWNGTTWRQLGTDMVDTYDPVISAYRETPYLALAQRDGQLQVMRWRNGTWQRLPSPGVGSSPAIDFSPSGKPVLAFAEVGDTVTRLRVRYFKAGAWQDVGEAVTEPSSSDVFVRFDLSIDAKGRPTVGWTSESTGESSVFVKRYQQALP